ncbi:HNH endonuclease [Microvenator marinus]|nr:SAVED domain-containing protein [Microvenator marinus]
MTKLYDKISQALRDNEGVLRIGKLKDAVDYQKSVDSFRRELKAWTEADSCPIRFEVSGYIAYGDTDFSEWSKKHRGRGKLTDYTVLRVWSRAGGQCQFPGCTKDLTEDPLTKSVGNFAQIAHIVAASPDGPRGCEDLSQRLGDKFENLMLLCYPHHRLIDTDVDQYSVEVLNDMKRRHEDRLDAFLASTDAYETHMVLISGVIRGQPTRIVQAEAARALSPRFANNRVLEVDLTNALPEETDDLYWRSGAEILKKRLRQALEPRPNERLDHLSVFALAAIPLLVLAGRLIGDKRRAELYQNQRDLNSWSWFEEVESADTTIELVRPETIAKDRTAVLALSFSQDVDIDQVRATVGGDIDLYVMRAAEPSYNWLKHRVQLDAFRKKYLQIQDELERKYGKTRTLHVFAAVPAPVAIEIGRSLHPKVAPELVVYDYIDGLYVRGLVIPKDISSVP